jgi:hypothetical protein
MPVSSFAAAVEVGTKMKSLIQILEPIWKVSYWIGVLPGWCHSVQRGQCSRIFNRIGVFVSTLIITMLTCYQTFRLIVDSMEVTSMRSIIFSLIGLFPHWASVILSIYIQMRNKAFLEFFQLWNQLEHHPLMQNHRKFNKNSIKMVIFLMASTYLVSAVEVVTIFFNTLSPSSLSRQPELVNIFTRPVLLAIQSLTNVYVSTILLVGGAVPTLFAYETGSMLNAMASATRQIFDDLETFKTNNSLTKQFHELWYLFEQLRLKVDEANNLFGVLALLVHAIFFLIVCLTVDTFVLNTKSLQLADLIALPTFVFIFAMFLITVILIASESEKSSRQLAVTVSMGISRNGSLLTETERLVLRCS